MALREVLARFGIKADTKPLDRADRRVSSTTRSIRGLVAAAGGAATIAAMRRFVGDSISAGDELHKTAIQVGLTTSELQGLRHAANLGGVGATEFSNALGQLQRRADDAANGGSETSEAFRRLGVDVNDVNGNLLPANELFLRVAEGLNGLDNSSEKTALSMELMGRQGRRMLPMFAEGRAGIEAMAGELDELGGGASEEFIQQSVALTDDITRANLAVTSFRTTLLTALLPTMSRVVTWMTRVAATLAETGAAAAAAKPIIIALGIAGAAAGIQMGIAWGAAVAPVLLAAAAAALLYLAIDDIIVALDGGDSVIGEFTEEWVNFIGIALGVEEILGGTLPEAVEGAKLMFEDFVGVLSDAYQWIADIIALSPGVRALSSIFGVFGGPAESVEGSRRPATESDDEFVARSNQERRARREAQAQGAAFRNITDHSQRRLAAIEARTGVRQITAVTPEATRTERLAATQATEGRRQNEATGLFRGSQVAAAPTQTSNVEIGPTTNTFNITEAQSSQATRQVVRTELSRQEAARNRAVLAAVEPARESS